MWTRDTFHHNRAVFPVRHHGSFPRRTAWYGVFLCSHDIVCNRHGRDAYFMDLCIFPASQIPVFSVYLVSGILAGNDRDAGDLLLLCAEKMLIGCEESRFGKEKISCYNVLGNEQKIRLLPGDKVQKGKKMKLYIIRHGETSWNKQKKLQGQRDIMLNDAGIRLAELTGEGMKDIDFDLVISSPLIRAKQTAELVMAGRHLPMITDRRIIELSFGDWEGECVRDSKVLPPDFIDKFYNDPYHCMRAPGGESFQDVLKRTEDFYQSLVQNKAYENATIFISTHGAAGRCLLANFYDDKEDIWRGGIPKNCSVCIVEVKDGVGTVLEKDKIFYDEAE